MQKQQKTKKKNIGKESYSKKETLPKKNILGVGITNDTKENILEFIIETLRKKAKPYYVVTPNPEMLVLASKNPDFQNALNGADLALNDGVGVGLAAQILGNSLKGRFTGVELVEKLCEKVSNWPITVGFLGGGPKIAEKTAECLLGRYPNLQVDFVGEEWPNGFSGKEEVASSKYLVADKDQRTKRLTTNYQLLTTPVVDILLVAYGAPKQEFWMREHVGKIPVKVMAGVGGAFDQIVDPSLRPPQIVQNIGFGWLYRLVRQPWRIKRQLALGEFVRMVIKEKFTMSS